MMAHRRSEIGMIDEDESKFEVSRLPLPGVADGQVASEQDQEEEGRGWGASLHCHRGAADDEKAATLGEDSWDNVM